MFRHAAIFRSDTRTLLLRVKIELSILTLTRYINTTLTSHHSHFIHQAFEDGPDRGFRNVGQYKPDAGESPKS
jgi:hypothetical protein